MTTSASEKKSLLSLVVDSHGGLDAWQKVSASTFKLNFSGAFLAHKGYPYHYQLQVRVNISPIRTEIRGLDLENPSDIWTFTPDRVWTQDENGNMKQSRSKPREAFQGHTRDTKWDQLHLLYFIGYALTNYVNIPFSLVGPGFETREIEDHWEPGYVNSSGASESWRVIEISYPLNYHAHTRVQKYYFDREKLWIRRMDYVADVAGGIASHYCFDHQVVKGIVVPMLRRVVDRIPETDTAMIFGPSGFVLDYFDVDFEG